MKRIEERKVNVNISKLFLLILTSLFLWSSTSMKADINVSYGISCSTLTNRDGDGNITDRTFIPSDLFAGVRIGDKHQIGLKVETAIADMYEFNTKDLNFHFNSLNIR